MKNKPRKGQFTKENASKIGASGGIATKLSGKVDYAEIGRRGAERRWRKISTGEGKRAWTGE